MLLFKKPRAYCVASLLHAEVEADEGTTVFESCGGESKT